MAAIGNLTLTDAASTPVNHTYNPMDCTTSKALWAEQAVEYKAGQPTVQLSFVELPKGITRVDITYQLPVMETITGDAGGFTPAPQVAYVMKGTSSLFLPGRSTLQNRKDLLALFRDLLGDTVVQNAVWNYERPF